MDEGYEAAYFLTAMAVLVLVWLLAVLIVGIVWVVRNGRRRRSRWPHCRQR